MKVAWFTVSALIYLQVQLYQLYFNSYVVFPSMK